MFLSCKNGGDVCKAEADQLFGEFREQAVNSSCDVVWTGDDWSLEKEPVPQINFSRLGEGDTRSVAPPSGAVDAAGKPQAAGNVESATSLDAAGNLEKEPRIVSKAHWVHEAHRSAIEKYGSDDARQRSWLQRQTWAPTDGWDLASGSDSIAARDSLGFRPASTTRSDFSTMRRESTASVGPSASQVAASASSREGYPWQQASREASQDDGLMTPALSSLDGMSPRTEVQHSRLVHLLQTCDAETRREISRLACKTPTDEPAEVAAALVLLEKRSPGGQDLARRERRMRRAMGGVLSILQTPDDGSGTRSQLQTPLWSAPASAAPTPHRAYRRQPSGDEPGMWACTGRKVLQDFCAGARARDNRALTDIRPV